MKPVNRDTLLDALEQERIGPHKTLPASRQPYVHELLYGLVRDRCRTAQWFDFGTLSSAMLTEIADDADPFMDAGYFILPYPSVIFRARVYTPIPKHGTAEEIAAWMKNNRVTEQQWRNMTASKERSECESILFATYGPKGPPSIFVTTFNAYSDDSIDLLDMTTLYPQREIETVNNATTGITVCTLNALWLILNTRHVNRHVDNPSEALNRARAKRGKRALQPVTRIDSAQYITALRETQAMERQGTTSGGHHRSPKMHLRRAHLRHWRDRIIPIRAMIVNAHKEIAPVREKYVLT